jgi:hypothetical protein
VKKKIDIVLVFISGFDRRNWRRGARNKVRRKEGRDRRREEGQDAVEKVVKTQAFAYEREKRVAVLGATAQATRSSGRGCHPTPTLAHWITAPGSSGGLMPPRWLGNGKVIKGQND